MQKIKKWFLRLLVVLIALAMIGVLLVMLINNRVKSQTKDDILYAMQADMEINAVSKQNNIMRIRKKAGPPGLLFNGIRIFSPYAHPSADKESECPSYQIPA